MTERLAFKASDVFLFLTEISFDISILECIYPLTIGARIVLAPPEGVKSGEDLWKVVRSNGVNVIQATPSSPVI